jgi:hypothetical protein
MRARPALTHVIERLFPEIQAWSAPVQEPEWRGGRRLGPHAAGDRPGPLESMTSIARQIVELVRSLARPAPPTTAFVDGH